MFSIDNRRKEVSSMQTLVLNDGPFGHALAVSFFRRRARLCSRAFKFFTAVSKTDAVSWDTRFLLTKVMYSITMRKPV